MAEGDLEDQVELDVEEIEPLEFWKSKQKELVTSVVDYNLSTIVELVAEDTIDLNPSYQRRLRWDNAKKSRLIESFLMNVPVPPVFLNEDEYGKYSVIDGKQRLDAVSEFLTNSLVLEGLSIFSDINNLRFNDLPSKFRSIIRTRPTLRAVIILRQSDSDIKYDVFHRLNAGGQKLNAQEIRNNAFHGSLNKLIMRLSDTKEFHRALGIKNKHKSAIFQEMRDAELVLRYFTFHDNWREFSGGIKRTMDTFMDQNRNPTPERLAYLEDKFSSTLRKASAVFDDHAFERWMPERGSFRKHPLAALFDVQMFTLQNFEIADLMRVKHRIVDDFQALFANPDFRKAVDAATNTPTLFKTRIGMFEKILLGALRGR